MQKLVAYLIHSLLAEYVFELKRHIISWIIGFNIPYNVSFSKTVTWLLIYFAPHIKFNVFYFWF